MVVTVWVVICSGNGVATLLRFAVYDVLYVCEVKLVFGLLYLFVFVC